MNRVDPWVPLGAAILAYHNGRHDAVLSIDSDVFDSEDVPAAHFYRPVGDPLPDLDSRALERCRGNVLDAGAGAGRHALELQNRGLEVTALDVAEDAVDVMRRRGLADPRKGDVFNSKLGSYTTILLLMNGIGLAGTIEGLDKLMARFSRLLRPGGEVIFDASGLDAVIGRQQTEALSDLAVGRPQLGEVYFRLTFDDLEGSWYPWLFPSPTLVANSARASGFEFTVIGRGSRGSYLASLAHRGSDRSPD